MIRKTLVAAAATTLAVSGAGIAMAAGGSAGPQAGGTDPVVHAKTGAGISCNGGKQKATLTKINGSASTFGEGADFTVPGMGMTVQGPSHGTDTLNLTFSAENQLRGSSASDRFDWIELEVLVDGTPVRPSGPTADPLALGGSPYYASNAAQFCTKIGHGAHQVKVVTRLVDNGSADSLTGWIDDATLNAVKSE